ncbi:MAG: hypothetical protein MSS60_06145 [Clostridiales bacterium]|nr:hypothetical protein [Clostridiales bacterium]
MNEILMIGGVDKRGALGCAEGRNGRWDKRLARRKTPSLAEQRFLF